MRHFSQPPLSDDERRPLDDLWAEIESRFGTCPSFFKLGQADPKIARRMFRITEFAYLDNPIPGLFKEKLFTWLSRFCDVRYCVARHCAFLLSQGVTADEALALLNEPMPGKEELQAYLAALEQTPAPLATWPEFDSELGRHVRVACAVSILDPSQARLWLSELSRLLGAQRYEQLMFFLAFVRVAHFWTQVHPLLEFEPDLTALLREHESLVEPLLQRIGEVDRWRIGKQLYEELQYLRQSQESIRAIRDSEARFRAIFENAAVGISRVDLEGRFLEVNQRLCDIVGYSRDELLTKSFTDITHPEDRDAGWSSARRLLTGEANTYLREKRYCRKDGSIVWGNLNVSIVRTADGSPDYFVSVVEDITARKQAEQDLRQRDERLLLASRVAGLGIFEWDVKADRAVWENERMYEIFGHTRADGALSKVQLVARYVHPDDASSLEQTLATGVQTGTPIHSVYRIRRKDGVQRWLDLTGTFQLGSDGKPERMIGVLADITDRQQGEEALRESESRFRQLAESLPLLVWTCRPDGSCDYISPQYVEYTGIPESQQLGFGWLQQVHPDDRDRVMNRWSQTTTGNSPFNLECRLRRRDNVYRWFKSQAVGLRNSAGEIIKWFGSDTDIDDQKKAGQALAESEQRLAGIVSSAMDGIITIDEDQRIVLFNEAAQQMLHCSAENALGRSINEFIPEPYRRAHKEHIRRFGETGGTTRAMGNLGALSARRADGTEFPIEASISSVKVGTKRLYTVILRDITERKRAETEREQLSREQAARAVAEAANRSKDEFLAMVSHELRSPLNAILGYTRILRSGPMDRVAIDKATAVVERSARAQLQIIEDLLDSARIVTGKLRIEPGPVDLVPVLEAALDTVRSAAAAKGVMLGANFAPQPEEVLGDSTRLQQIVWNLLSNAVKFTPAGGKIELRMEHDADYVRIIVSDSGKGIEPSFIPFVFESFSQADASSSRRFGGLGLGLSLVKHLVELHGGSITATSEGLNRGATFIVTLPRRQPEFISVLPAVVQREVRTEGAIVLEQALSLEGVNVLVVDDQEEARVVLTQTLSEYGADVTAVSSGAEALALLSIAGSTRPDVLILDIAMPGEDGYEVLRRVRAFEATQGPETVEIPAVALTAYGRSEDRLRALQAGFHMHVAKPVEPAELAVVIASLTTKSAWDRGRRNMPDPDARS